MSLGAMSLGGLSLGGLSLGHASADSVDEEVAQENLRLRLQVLELSDRLTCLSSQVELLTSSTREPATPCQRRQACLGKWMRRSWLARKLVRMRSRLVALRFP
jgi:hypothetical protein